MTPIMASALERPDAWSPFPFLSYPPFEQPGMGPSVKCIEVMAMNFSDAKRMISKSFCFKEMF